MTEKINWTLNIHVEGGPKVLASESLEVEAYDMIEVKIMKDDENKEVHIQPGDAGQVQLLLIKSDIYGDELTYKVNEKTDIIKLDALQVLIGDGAVKLLGESPKKLKFTNKLAEPDHVKIQIFVGRKATTS